MDKKLEKRVADIESRNKKVEADKAWELSWTRRIAIMILIYATVGVYLGLIVHISPWINGLVPVIGYFLSTITVQKLKQWWIRKH